MVAENPLHIVHGAYLLAKFAPFILSVGDELPFLVETVAEALPFTFQLKERCNLATGGVDHRLAVPLLFLSGILHPLLALLLGLGGLLVPLGESVQRPDDRHQRGRQHDIRVRPRHGIEHGLRGGGRVGGHCSTPHGPSPRVLRQGGRTGLDYGDTLHQGGLVLEVGLNGGERVARNESGL